MEIENEIVFIGQEMDKEKIRQELDQCLSSEEEILSNDWKSGMFTSDEWPVERYDARKSIKNRKLANKLECGAEFINQQRENEGI